MRKLIYILALAFVVMSCEKNKEPEYTTYKVNDIYGQWIIDEVKIGNMLIPEERLSKYSIVSEKDGATTPLENVIVGQNIDFYGDSQFSIKGAENTTFDGTIQFAFNVNGEKYKIGQEILVESGTKTPQPRVLFITHNEETISGENDYISLEENGNLKIVVFSCIYFEEQDVIANASITLIMHRK